MLAEGHHNMRTCIKGRSIRKVENHCPKDSPSSDELRLYKELLHGSSKPASKSTGSHLFSGHP